MLAFDLSTATDNESGIVIPGMQSHFLEPAGPAAAHGRLRYLTGGTGAPLILLHTVRTQAALERPDVPAKVLNDVKLT